MIVKAGFRVPVASNKYDPLHITVVQDSEMLGQIADAAWDPGGVWTVVM